MRALPLMHLARLAFLAACAAFLVLGFRGHGAEITAALSRVSAGGVLLAVGVTLAGLAAMAALWMRIASDFGLRIPRPQATSIYFLSQLGKYIPGSVWSIGAQAHMTAAFDAKPRISAGAGLVALGYFVASGALVGTTLAAFGLIDPPWPRFVSAAATAALLVSLTPVVINRAAKIAAGAPLDLTWSRAAVNVGLCALLWTAWTVGVVAPFGDYDLLLTAAGAFGICYAVGVLIILAPAGLGAREALLIALLAPSTSLAHASAIALVSRLVHATADVTAAIGSWAWSKVLD